MKNIYMLVASLLAVSLLGGCASNEPFPLTANVVIPEDDQGNVGMSSYKEKAVFQNATTKMVVDAAKAGLGKAGFVPTLVDEADGVVFAENGSLDLIAGVDIKETGNDAMVVVVVRGSSKTGSSDESTAGAWPRKIVKGMQDYMAQTGK